MLLSEIRIGISHTAGLNLYLNLSNTFQCLKYTGLELDYASYDLVCLLKTTIFIASVFAGNRNCVLCVNAVEDEERLLFSCPLSAETSSRYVSKRNYGLFAECSRLKKTRQICFVLLSSLSVHALKKRKEFTGSS